MGFFLPKEIKLILSQINQFNNLDCFYFLMNVFQTLDPDFMSHN